MLPEVGADLTVMSSADTGKRGDSSGATLTSPVPPTACPRLPSLPEPPARPSSLRPGVGPFPACTEGLNLWPVGDPGPRPGRFSANEEEPLERAAGPPSPLRESD